MKRIAILLALLWSQTAWGAEFGYHPGSAPANPVLMDGGFGFVNTGDATAALKHTAGAGETIDSVYAWVYSDDFPTDDINIKVYTMTAGQPDSRVLVATLNNIGTGPPLVARGADVNYAMTNGVIYCLGIDTSNTVSVVCGYDAGGTNDAESKTTPLPATWGTPGTNQNFKYGIWAVYTTSGGAGAPNTAGGNSTAGGNTTSGGR